MTNMSTDEQRRAFLVEHNMISIYRGKSNYFSFYKKKIITIFPIPFIYKRNSALPVRLSTPPMYSTRAKRLNV